MRSSRVSALESRKDMRYLDSHAHIFSEEFAEDFDAMLARAEAAGVRRMVIITTAADEAERAMAFAAKQPQRFQAAYGIHPEDIRTVTEEKIAEMAMIAADPRLSFVGEIGLDYHWEKEMAEAQKELFIRQIEIARQVGKPIMVHSRDAHQDTFDILKEHHVPGVLHCFAGSAELAREYVKLGYYIALGGAVTFKNARHAKEVCAAIDPAYLLSETDCPYMSPEPVRGTRNEPANIPHIVRVMAQVRQVSEEAMAEQIWQNGQRFLGVTE